LPVSKKERDVSFWVQGGGYGRCGCISRLRQQSGNRRLLLAAMGPVVRHLPARLPNDFDLTDGLLPTVQGGDVPASSVAMCQSLLIQVVGFCGWGLRSMTRRALPAERSIWPGSATVTSTPKPITFRM
jgi:hypothetical protein